RQAVQGHKRTETAPPALERGNTDAVAKQLADLTLKRVLVLAEQRCQKAPCADVERKQNHEQRHGPDNAARGVPQRAARTWTVPGAAQHKTRYSCRFQQGTTSNCSVVYMGSTWKLMRLCAISSRLLTVAASSSSRRSTTS